MIFEDTFLYPEEIFVYMYIFLKIIFSSMGEGYRDRDKVESWKIEIRVDPARKSFLTWNGTLCEARDLFDAI